MTNTSTSWRCLAPVSRMMVRQVQSSSNAGTFTNGMPMTSSMGCGILGRQQHQRKRFVEALHERDVGQPADSGRPAFGSKTCLASSITARFSRQRSADTDPTPLLSAIFGFQTRRVSSTVLATANITATLQTVAQFSPIPFSPFFSRIIYNKYQWRPHKWLSGICFDHRSQSCWHLSF